MVYWMRLGTLGRRTGGRERWGSNSAFGVGRGLALFGGGVVGKGVRVELRLR